MKTDLEIIAKTLYAESRGEQLKGIQAVATVIYNRAKGDTSKMAQVCLKPKAFSCWNDVNDIVIKEPKIYKICEKIANDMLSKTFICYPFINIKPTNYLTVSLYSSSKCPNWARGQKGEIIGNHIFIELKYW
jgi:hypothetical protein